MWWRRLAEVQTEHQNGEERGFKTLNMEWVPGGLFWVFQKLLIYWDFHTQQSLGFKEIFFEKEKIFSEWQLCGRKCLVDGRLVRDDRNATVTQITTRYNQGMQNTISERTTHRTLKQMATAAEDNTECRSCQLRTGNEGYNGTGSPKLDNRRLEKRCLVWGVSVSAATFRWQGQILRKEEKHGSILPCLNGSGWWWRCNGVGIFSWHTLGRLVPIEHRLNATAYLSIVADHVHPFMTTVYPSLMVTSSRISHKAQIISDWFLEHDSSCVSSHLFLCGL